MILQQCNNQIKMFIKVCSQIKFPVSLEKTFWQTMLLVFLGLLLDTVNQIVCIPKEKVEKAVEMVDFFTDANTKKVTILQVQRLCGFLNFLSSAIIPGRAFTMRFY